MVGFVFHNHKQNPNLMNGINLALFNNNVLNKNSRLKTSTLQQASRKVR
jgi:hypothetical protein